VRIENSFDVAATPEAAWALLMDVPRVIPCMPGAELVETVDDANWKARMRVKLGPISLAFLTDVKRDEVDEAARRVKLAASAREERGRGAASATIESSLTSDGGTTTVSTVTELTLTGAVAQYGRGLVQDVSAQLLKQFAACLEAQLATGATEAGGEEPPPPPPPQKPVGGLRLGLGALWRSFLGLFRRR
jgi:carbon monoxide dehydrogenase subunit G